MASSSTVSCGVCDSQHTTTNADYWCPECDEGLCSQCLKYHSASKALRNHDIISVDNYKQLPPSIANISPYCSQHDRKFKNYCPQHESISCPLCIQSNHANCVGILSLENVIQTAKTSVLLESLDQNLKDIKLNFERVVKDRTQNLVEIQNQRQKFHDEIKQLRNKINEHLDSLEQLILQDLYAAEEKVKSQIEDFLGKLAEHTEKMDLLQTNMSAIKEYASDLQAFLGSKMVETEIKKHEIFMQSLFEDGSLQKIDLNCKIKDNLSDVLSTVTSFGSISVESNSPLVVLQTEKDKQAQIRTFHHAPPTTVNDIKMTLKRKFEFTCVTGCSFSSKGDIFLVDYGKIRLLILKEDGTLHSDIPLSNQNPVDVTCIDDKTVAVSFQSSNQIQIINILTKKIESMIKTTSSCQGICYADGHLLCCNTGTGIQKVKVSDNRSSTLVKDDTLSGWSFVTTSKDKIFYTNRSNNTVSCYTVTGEKKWEYKDQSVRSPRGISVDKDSNVYIASYGNNIIIVLSSDGKQVRKLLGTVDGIRIPFGLAFDVKKDKLIVANHNGPVLYERC
ncbi:transcription intermediary factor 1-alpha-like [Mytilus californianus]|uniref:transcription intermediary factor 1-alpha-like n=1 Tax=Mytilus californianus TaxID=6549 RepID=UPI002246174B|nr:transcription intermediary factor 1-alpha-like [Mytilus californianus]XP_052101424.1 transcription intermediary factor 1-alpha-like [Mytilus californianus]